MNSKDKKSAFNEALSLVSRNRNIGIKIAQLREKKELTQEQLADILNLNRSTLANWETGYRAPSRDNLKKIANFFGVTTDYLIGLSSDTMPSFEDAIRSLGISEKAVPLAMDVFRNIAEEFEEASKDIPGPKDIEVPYSDVLTYHIQKIQKDYREHLAKDRSSKDNETTISTNQSNNEKNQSNDEMPKARFKYGRKKKTGIPILREVHIPIELKSEMNIEDRINLSEEYEDAFIIIVGDDSMTHAGINKDDAVICFESAEVKSGELCVILIPSTSNQNSYKLILRFYIEENDRRIYRAANPDYPDLLVDHENMLIGIPEVIFRSIDELTSHTYLNESDFKNWSEVIKFASSAGLSPANVKQILMSQIELSKKIQERMPELFKELKEGKPDPNKKNGD